MFLRGNISGIGKHRRLPRYDRGFVLAGERCIDNHLAIFQEHEPDILSIVERECDQTENHRSNEQDVFKSRCRSKMIFADVCFSGRIRTNEESSATPISTAKKSDVLLFLSSRSDEFSRENIKMKNGVFTTYLQKGLRGGADADKDRVITAKELYNYAHGKVVELTNGHQHPVMCVGDFSDNMPVITW